MVQAKLPDLNNYWIKYHDYGLNALTMQNYDGVIGAINGINAILPDEYRVEINSSKYEEQLQSNTLLTCNGCKAETNYNEIEPFDMILSNLESVILDSKTVSAWVCPECKKENDFSLTKKIISKHTNPFYHKVINEPPRREQGCQGRLGFHRKMSQWFYGALEELDHQLGLYRKEYVAEGERDDIAEFEEYVPDWN